MKLTLSQWFFELIFRINLQINHAKKPLTFEIRDFLFLSKLFNKQRADRVQHGQHHHADIGEDCQPHVGDT